MMGLALGGAALGIGLLYLATHDHGSSNNREIWLIQGQWYSIDHRIVGPGWDASMYPGFCQFSQPVITGQIGSATEVQFKAQWCAPNELFQVPDNMAIAQVS